MSDRERQLVLMVFASALLNLTAVVLHATTLSGLTWPLVTSGLYITLPALFLLLHQPGPAQLGPDREQL